MLGESTGTRNANYNDRMAAFDVLLFDTMGTVVDVSSSIVRELTEVLGSFDRATAVAGRWDELMGAAMSEVNAGAMPWRSHRSLRRETLRQMRDEGLLPGLDAATALDLETVIKRVSSFPDSAAGLVALRDQVIVVALSNADLDELAALSRHAGLAWHAVISAELARAYKPDPSVYRKALNMLRTEPRRTLMVAAHPWDLRAAATHGMATAYIARPGAEPPAAGDRFTLQVADLGELSHALSAPPSPC